MITLVNISDRKVRMIDRLTNRSKMYVKAILIPTLNLKVTEVGIPYCFNKYNHMKTNISWAQNDEGLKGPVGQLLLGADCIEYFPYNLTHPNSRPVMTRKMSLLVSNLTIKIIRFGSAVKYDKEILNHSILVNKVASDTTNYRPFLSNTDFTQY